ncbi:hypothetical protein EVAR_18936_1 [Eumeta japonica]|uniref:Uncharacterized protein n=1 Tax=Eumeta variegata TaxID=151549 RepID=A0A4C1V1W5_EUMVA|nr:hypothetical protein EVAR_18936_1 [Eumeta japonica]
MHHLALFAGKPAALGAAWRGAGRCARAPAARQWRARFARFWRERRRHEARLRRAPPVFHLAAISLVLSDGRIRSAIRQARKTLRRVSAANYHFIAKMADAMRDVTGVGASTEFARFEEIRHGTAPPSAPLLPALVGAARPPPKAYANAAHLLHFNIDKSNKRTYDSAFGRFHRFSYKNYYRSNDKVRDRPVDVLSEAQSVRLTLT